jgi:uncharacterized protein (TIGR02598 family)
MKGQNTAFIGFTLIEVTLAMTVAAISLTAVFALLATGSQANHTAAEETGATEILTAVANDLRATPAASPTSIQFGILIPSNPVENVTSSTLFFDQFGKSSPSMETGSRYRVTVNFLPTETGRFATLATLRLTWPAPADPSNANTSAVELFIALDRN